MPADRRKQLLLGALAVVLLFVIYRAWPQTSATSSPSSNGNRPASRSRTATPAGGAPDVRLEALSAERPEPEPGQRDLFRFKPKPEPPSPVASKPAENGPAAPVGPPPPPPVPPIALKFIGVIDRGGQKIAVLSDSAGHVDYGGEGAIIGGRYRVVRIGVESIELAHLDGRGRQTIRLTGS